ncbi:MAG: LysR family transcriptional regulator [Mycobacterium sp.]
MLHLRCFVAVAEELNYSAAARPLRMATSALSQRGATREERRQNEIHDDEDCAEDREHDHSLEPTRHSRLRGRRSILRVGGH